MKKNVATMTALLSTAVALCLSKPVQAQVTDTSPPPQIPPTPPAPQVVPAENTAPPPLAKTETGRNTIGPSVSLGGGAAIGIDSKFPIAENISLRPFIYFGNGGTDFGTSLTYDINLKTTNSTNKITPFIGGAVDIKTATGNSITTASLVAGAEYELTETIQLKGAFNIPISSNQGQTTNITLGAGVRF